MGKKRNLSENEKILISFLCQNTKKSYGEIADFLDLSKWSVWTYRNYIIQDEK